MFSGFTFRNSIQVSKIRFLFLLMHRGMVVGRYSGRCQTEPISWSESLAITPRESKHTPCIVTILHWRLTWIGSVLWLHKPKVTNTKSPLYMRRGCNAISMLVRFIHKQSFACIITAVVKRVEWPSSPESHISCHGLRVPWKTVRTTISQNDCVCVCIRLSKFSGSCVCNEKDSTFCHISVSSHMCSSV